MIWCNTSILRSKNNTIIPIFYSNSVSNIIINFVVKKLPYNYAADG